MLVLRLIGRGEARIGNEGVCKMNVRVLLSLPLSG